MEQELILEQIGRKLYQVLLQFTSKLVSSWIITLKETYL